MNQSTSNGVFANTYQQLTFYRIQALASYPHLEHAMFTRRGGNSESPYRSLNLSTSVGHGARVVQKNVDDACRAINVAPRQTVSCHLIHGSDVIIIDRSNRREILGDADGLITRDRDVFLFMRFGDCIPLLFFDPEKNVVGLTHAGWRGTMKNAAGVTVEQMVNQYRCRPEDIIAAIGPSIGPCCYEVGPDVVSAADAVFTEPASLFEPPNGYTGRKHFDMWEANRRQLVTAGVRQIVQTGLCTACRTGEFFSHRAEKGRTGRFGVIIGLRGDAG
jgi:YfiH family protein